jgi:hypothetical protein
MRWTTIRPPAAAQGGKAKMMITIPDELYQQLRSAKLLAVNRLLRPNYFANVVGVGIGPKEVDGDLTDTLCIRVYVQSKLDIDDLTPSFIMPDSFLGFPTDIIEVGRFGRTGLSNDGLQQSAELARGIPIRVDSPASNVNSGAFGTLGAIAAIAEEPPYYILSCNHVLNVNGRVRPEDRATIAAIDGTVLATPGLFQPLTRSGENLVDCGLAPLLHEVNARSLEKPVPPKLGMSVQKKGAATLITRGRIVDVDADLYVDYSFGTFRFKNQIVIDGKSPANEDDIFATDGDSGAIVMGQADTGEYQPIAMVFAEAGRFGVACPLVAAFKLLENAAGLRDGSLSLVVTEASPMGVTSIRSSSKY